MSEVKNSDLIDSLVSKSIEAFLLGIEIYNKPTIKYRLEGISFFLCNAWELMLKAKLLKDGKSIYYKQNRTYDLGKVVKTIYTDNKQPLRLNLEKIIELRNESTHYITREYEQIYAPFLQACVLNYCNQLKRFHEKKIADYMPQSFIYLPIFKEAESDKGISSSHPKEIAEKILRRKHQLEHLEAQNSSPDLYIPIKVNYFQVKDKDSADITYAIDKNAKENVKIVKKMTDPQSKFTLSAKNLIKAVNDNIKSHDLEFNYTAANGKNTFNQYTLGIIDKKYNIKGNKELCYKFETIYRYSYDAVDYITGLISNDPDIVLHIKEKIAPGS